MSTVSRVDWDTFYSPGLVRTASVGGMPTEVIGADPVAATQGLTLPAYVGGAGLRPVEPGTVKNRLVLVFNPARPANEKSICLGDAPVAARDGGLKVTAVLCYGGFAYAHGMVTNSAVPGPGAPGYAQSMRDVFVAMMPAVNPHIELDGREWND
ncbi:hypothetical protein [Futiania mangrovi]|uniref:Uncharacterized protein n=1 Tax=Futiania mangrovi TaxID=2959716 RepID=A0A9J6PD34_9PROT|nr:hypothetical protein [Futiania mangrovii]MCP1335579.1 hypothetical protein [Futiania mangrovii]